MKRHKSSRQVAPADVLFWLDFETRARVAEREAAGEKRVPLFLHEPDYVRSRAARYKDALRARLKDPIKLYKLSKDMPRAGDIEIDQGTAARIKGKSKKERERILQVEWLARKEKEEVDVRLEAAMALYDIPASFSREVQVELLAYALLGDLFDCKVLPKGRGGARQSTLFTRAERKRELAELYRQFRAQHPPFKTDDDASKSFLKAHKAECAGAGIFKARSLTNAMRRMAVLH